MRNRRTATALILAAATLAGGAVWATEGWFPDVPDDHRRIDAIRYAKTEGLFQGFPDGNLRPDAELSEGQFVKVAERLYDRYDVWTRADWAQVLYGGLPSLTDVPPPSTTAAPPLPPVVDASLCGWPLGDAEPVGKVPPTGPPEEIRWPITPCAPPVTYRIEFQDQTLNLPYTSTAQVFTPTLDWRTNANLDAAKVKVTEYRPGGPADGKVVGERWIPWRAVRERDATTTETIPLITTTAAPTTTTTSRPPTQTLPPPEIIREVPYEERDVVAHWFIYPAGAGDNQNPGVVVYLADPGGPIPLSPRAVDLNFSTEVYTESGGEDATYTLQPTLYERGDRAPRAAFPVAISGLPSDLNSVVITPPEDHPFRSLTFNRVVPPAPECVEAWRNHGRRGHRRFQEENVHATPECRPAEWDKWWGVRANAPDE